MIEINQERLQKVMGLPLLQGGHSPNSKYCVMEAAAYIAGEPWSDAPKCVCPVIRSFMVSWNDSLPTDEDRERLLKPLLTKVINTNSTDAIAEKRSYMAIDWLIRVHTPKFLDLTDSLKGHAKSLRELEEITDLAGMTAVGDITSAADSAARWAADWAADWAARSAARSAADLAAHSAAHSAADWAARSAARSAADLAARSAARSAADLAARSAADWAADWAARSAAHSALQPTVEWLQASASDLVIRMCEVE